LVEIGYEDVLAALGVSDGGGSGGTQLAVIASRFATRRQAPTISTAAGIIPGTNQRLPRRALGSFGSDFCHLPTGNSFATNPSRYSSAIKELPS
jgi:hypothetical protein